MCISKRTHLVSSLNVSTGKTQPQIPVLYFHSYSRELKSPFELMEKQEQFSNAGS